MRFDLLGPLRVTQDGQPVQIGGAKQQLVLASLLLARGTVVSTDRLVEMVWGEEPPSKPNVTLRSYVSHLRRVIEPKRETGERATTLVTRAPGYALEIDRAQVDLFGFEEAVADARALVASGQPSEALGILTGGLNLWRSVQLGDGLLDPVDPEVVSSSELRIGAMVLQQELLLQLGRHSEALPHLEGMLADEPLREGPRHLHMLALHRAGRKADALASFQVARLASIEQLGLEPGAALRELEAAILSDDIDLQWRESTKTFAAPTAPPAATLTPPPVGREHEADLLSSQLDTSIGGKTTLAVLTGEPGIGKTTLLQNTVLRAQRLDFHTVIGRCHDGGALSPMTPWMVVLEDLTADLSPTELEHVIGAEGSAIRRLLPGARATDGPFDASAGDQQALFHGVVRLLRRLADNSPILLAFEDLHWADPVTVRLLGFVSSELEASRIHLIVTWRDTDVVSDELAQGLADLGRAAQTGRLALGGLDTKASTDLFQDLFGQELSPDTAERIVSQTAGNPLFLLELLRSLATNGELKPTDTIRDALARRIQQLPEGAEQALTIGALCPGGFTEYLVSAVTGTSADDTLDLLEAALAARLIEEDPDSPEKFRFSHAVIAETLTSSLSGARRARYHAAIGNELEERGAAVDLLAHHLLRGAAAGTGTSGAEYAHRAAVEAMNLWAYTRAAELLEAGLEALLLGEDDDALRADLLIDLMQARKHQDRAQDAQELGARAFDVAKAAGDAERMTIAALVYCGWPRPTQGRQRDQWLGYWSPPGPSIAMLSACVDKVPADHWLRPAVLMALAAQHFGEHEDLVYCAELFAEAEALTRTQEDPDLQTSVLLAVFHKFQRTATLEQRHLTLDRILQLSQRHGLADQNVAARRARLVLALDRLDPAAAEEEERALVETATAARDPLLSMYAAVATNSMQLMRGEHAEAETKIVTAMDEFAHLGSATLDQLGLQYSLVAREHGRLDEVEAMLRWKLEGYPGPAFAGPLASILTLQGQNEEASELIGRHSRRGLTLGGEGVLQFITPCFFAEAVADLGDVERAGWLYDSLQAAEGRIVAMFDGVATYGCGSYYLGRLATVLGLHDEAEQHFTIADRFHNGIGARSYHLRTLLARAELDQATGQPTDLHLTEATTLAEELGMGWLVKTGHDQDRFNDSSTLR